MRSFCVLDCLKTSHWPLGNSDKHFLYFIDILPQSLCFEQTDSLTDSEISVDVDHNCGKRRVKCFNY